MFRWLDDSYTPFHIRLAICGFSFFFAIPLDMSIRISLEYLGVEFQKKKWEKTFR